MPQVLLGMGSNIDPEKHLRDAAKVLRKTFPDVQFSNVYRSAAVGMDGDDFLNACCLFTHQLSANDFSQWLKKLEDVHGRDRSEGSWKPRTLDLDILMVDDVLLDDDLNQYGHVYVPASELIICESSDKKFAALHKMELKLF
ncbi:MAG: 2-amino-4-hydroxy-6-hydroxymethyldihydropteridine diphosphokinase [Ghiorsea sp.]